MQKDKRKRGGASRSLVGTTCLNIKPFYSYQEREAGSILVQRGMVTIRAKGPMRGKEGKGVTRFVPHLIGN